MTASSLSQPQNPAVFCGGGNSQCSKSHLQQEVVYCACEKQIGIVICKFVSPKRCFYNLPLFWKELRLEQQCKKLQLELNKAGLHAKLLDEKGWTEMDLQHKMKHNTVKKNYTLIISEKLYSQTPWQKI